MVKARNKTETLGEYIATAQRLPQLTPEEIIKRDEIQQLIIDFQPSRLKKFVNWKPTKTKSKSRKNENIPPDYPHYTCTALAKAWGLSTDKIRQLFENEAGVLKLGNPNPKYKRRYVSLRIPSDIAEKVHRRMS